VPIEELRGASEPRKKGRGKKISLFGIAASVSHKFDLKNYGVVRAIDAILMLLISRTMIVL